ncbi:PoNe immunity protein domain-containing protein [Acinetobacter dispersus]|uniref:PoNe immunity protein domain-containing protein n=1 Tax=Acinetobacter dispersus TaxID=70348 RepID=UPI00300B1853
MDFENKKRQLFITERYFIKSKEYHEEGIPLYLESDAYEDDEYNCGEASRWQSITLTYWDLLLLGYTSGEPIEELISSFENIVAGYTKQAEALAVFKGTAKPSVINGEGGFIALTMISLAVLLNQKNKLPIIKKLINGGKEDQSEEDKVINKFFKILDSKHPDTNKDGVYSYDYSHLCDVIDNVLDKDDKAHALEVLDNYLSDWYGIHKNTLWYNSHLDLDNGFSYVGYWAFEAAFLVYMFDLDDTSLHKYLYYPKDIVQWIRHIEK